MKKISTSALAKKLNTDGKEFIKFLEENGYLKIENNIKILTNNGKENGGEIKTGTKFGDYIVWPEDFNPLKQKNIEKIKYINITQLGELFGIGARRMNQIISELSWIKRNTIGWKITDLGKNIGGIQLEIIKTGATYTKWPETIKENDSLLIALGKKHETKDVTKYDDYRKKYKAEKRTKDGHYVRSISEMLIDNALYDYGLTHAYERRVTNIDSEVLSDFYIPATKNHEAIWIEFWGIENEEKYNNRKNIKQQIYKKNNLNLIEIENKDIENLDDFLPRELSKFGIKVD